jgi:hypothetical protein
MGILGKSMKMTAYEKTNKKTLLLFISGRQI